jgi:hypothetical protein
MQLWHMFMPFTMAATVLALPAINSVSPTRLIAKRSPPQIADGFTDRQLLQINDGFRDALEFASYVLGSDQDDVKKRMAKYFNEEDFDTVFGMTNLGFALGLSVAKDIQPYSGTLLAM